jgi:predicted DNA repair protein MutK
MIDFLKGYMKMELLLKSVFTFVIGVIIGAIVGFFVKIINKRN